MSPLCCGHLDVEVGGGNRPVLLKLRSQVGTQTPEHLAAGWRQCDRGISTPNHVSSSQALSWTTCPTLTVVQGDHGVKFSAQQSVNAREVGQLQADMSKSWCVSSTCSWQDTEDPGREGGTGGPGGSRATIQEEPHTQTIMSLPP